MLSTLLPYIITVIAFLAGYYWSLASFKEKDPDWLRSKLEALGFQVTLNGESNPEEEVIEEQSQENKSEDNQKPQSLKSKVAEKITEDKERLAREIPRVIHRAYSKQYFDFNWYGEALQNFPVDTARKEVIKALNTFNKEHRGILKVNLTSIDREYKGGYLVSVLKCTIEV